MQEPAETIPTKKALAQHWLNDSGSLNAICETAQLEPTDTVLEIGPGTGSLTGMLAKRVKKVIAIEYDSRLVNMLKQLEANNLEIVHQDIRNFDLTSLPADYKIVANIPYYLSSYLLRLLSLTNNKPSLAVMLLQLEVAKRVAAKPGDMSVLAVSVQLEYQATLGRIIGADLFTPKPKVDSQILFLNRRELPLFKNLDSQKLIKLAKIGFSSRRKKLANNLAAGLKMSKRTIDAIINEAGLSAAIRAQQLSLSDWHRLYISIAVSR